MASAVCGWINCPTLVHNPDGQAYMFCSEMHMALTMLNEVLHSLPDADPDLRRLNASNVGKLVN